MLYVFKRPKPVTVTGAGHVLVFPPDVAVYVPPSLRAKVEELGAFPADATDEQAAAYQQKAVDAAAGAADSAEARKREILEAIQVIAESGDTKMFDSKGMPRVDAIKNLTGFSADNDVTAAERDVLWHEFQQGGGATGVSG